jgi:hypothetical protein
MDDITVIHHVFFAFQAQQSFFAAVFSEPEVT